MTRRAYRAVVLAAMPGTEAEIKEKTGLGRTTIWRWINDIRAAGECHITSWQRTDGAIAARYTAGPGTDRSPIKPLTLAEKSRRYRAKARKSGAWSHNLAQMRAVYWADRAKTQRDPLVAALFGRPT